MRALLLALRSLRREWRSGELAVLLFSLAVAVGALTGVGFLTDRIGRAVRSQATEVLAADARIESDEPIDATVEAEARRQGLVVVPLVRTLSVVFNGEASQLASVRAAGEGYPLRGRITVADRPFGAGQPAAGPPPRGEAWPDSRLAAALGAQVGSVLSVGAMQLRVTHVLASRPDQGAAFNDLASTLLINHSDLADTRLVQPNSRASWRLLLAGEPARLAAFRAWFDAHKHAGQRYAGVEEAAPQIADASQRAGRFLALASLVAALLCAVAVATSARSWVARHLDAVALLKTLGASRAFVLSVVVTQLLALALAATVLGTAAGYGAQAWLLRALAGLLRTDLPPPGWLPAFMGLLVSLAMLTGFALPSLLQLTRVPALRVLRRDAGPPQPRLWLALAPAALALVAVARTTLGEWPLAAGFLVGMALAVLALGLAAWALVRLAGLARGSTRLALRHGLANLARRRASSVSLVIAFGLGMMLVGVLAILRTDLVDDWRASLPADAPNYFFVNIPDDGHEAFAAELRADGARVERMLPMIRGRLTAINGRPPPAHEPLAEREQNLTWSADLGDDNRLVAGRWWTAADAGQPLVSVATEMQDALKVQVGDLLAFDIAGEPIEARVASIRKVKWDSFRPNFFLVFPPGLLDGTAGTWLTSARYEPSSGAGLARLVHDYPSVSVFNVGDLLAQVRGVVDKSVTAVQSVFLFTLLAGITVLLAAVQSSREERRLETAILRVLGAGRGMLRGAVLAEFLSLGIVAGVLAAAGATAGGWLLARQLGLHYRADVPLALLLAAATAVLVAASGWLATRSVLGEPPRRALR